MSQEINKFWKCRVTRDYNTRSLMNVRRVIDEEVLTQVGEEKLRAESSPKNREEGLTCYCGQNGECRRPVRDGNNNQQAESGFIILG